jgi:cholesterol oxidase
MTTFRGSGRGPLASIARFGGYFTKSMKDVYLRPAPPAPTASTKEEA